MRLDKLVFPSQTLHCIYISAKEKVTQAHTFSAPMAKPYQGDQICTKIKREYISHLILFSESFSATACNGLNVDPLILKYFKKEQVFSKEG